MNRADEAATFSLPAVPVETPAPVLTARAARTRDALIRAARSLFESQGYLDTNVNDIAKLARVAHGTFYTYFSSKEEIFQEVAKLCERAKFDMVARYAVAAPKNLADTRAQADTEDGKTGRFQLAQTAYRQGAAAEADDEHATRRFTDRKPGECNWRIDRKSVV